MSTTTARRKSRCINPLYQAEIPLDQEDGLAHGLGWAVEGPMTQGSSRRAAGPNRTGAARAVTKWHRLTS